MHVDYKPNGFLSKFLITQRVSFYFWINWGFWYLSSDLGEFILIKITRKIAWGQAMLKCGEVDKPLFGWHFVWVLCHFHAFSWQNSCLDTHFVLEKYSRSMEWKSWKVHALWRFEQLCHLTTIAVSSTAMAKWWHPFWTMSAFDDNCGKLITTIVHTMTIVVIPQCPKASVSQVSDHDHGGVQHNCSVFSGWYL